MVTTCPKCGYARQPTDAGPDYECPQCGIIYAKYRQPVAFQAQEESGRSGKGAMPLIWTVLLLCVAALAAWKYIELRNAGELGHALTALESLHSRWRDSVKVAAGADRMALAAPMQVMTGIYRETSALAGSGYWLREVPECFSQAKTHLSMMMKTQLEMIQLHMEDGQEVPPREYSETASGYAQKYKSVFDECAKKAKVRVK